MEGGIAPFYFIRLKISVVVLNGSPVINRFVSI